VKVTRDQVTETETFRFVTEASTIGLPPGNFPRTLETDLGNGQPLVRQDGGMERGVRYRQLLGCISVIIFND
jgi:hypothetical protein